MELMCIRAWQPLLLVSVCPHYHSAPLLPANAIFLVLGSCTLSICIQLVNNPRAHCNPYIEGPQLSSPDTATDYPLSHGSRLALNLVINHINHTNGLLNIDRLIDNFWCSALQVEHAFNLLTYRLLVLTCSSQDIDNCH